MPDNHDEPTHSLMRETARGEPWLLRLIGKPATTRVAILPIGAYHDLLSPLAAHLSIWRTTYYHPMPSAEIVRRLRIAGGDDIPSRPSFAQMVERGETPRDMERLVIGGRGRRDQADPLRHHRQRRQIGRAHV